MPSPACAFSVRSWPRTSHTQVRQRNNLPSGAQFVGKMLPGYHLAQLGWDSAGGFGLHGSDAIVLAAWAVGLAAVALPRWRREASATA
jgi:hypothetical protein